jgi:hypothetical protein
MKQKLIEFYLEFWNDFITVGHIAEYHGLTPDECSMLLRIGKKYFNENK